MALGNDERTNKRRRLRELDEQAQARVECILREQLDLEVYLKQKEISTIVERLRHSEVLLNVLQSAIQSQQHAYPSLDDVADGFMSHMRRLAITSSHRQSSSYQWQSQADDAVPARKRGRPRRSAAIPARYTDEHTKTLYAQRIDGSTVRMLCPYCRRDDFVSLQGFMNHARLDHDAHFASHDEAISICGVDADVSGDRDEDQADSDQSAGQRKATTASAAQSLRYDSLMNRLSDNQRMSVTDALDYINKPKDVGQESSDAGSDSESESVAAYSKHRAITGGNVADNMPPPLRAQDSRFHVVRRAIFGNTSQYIDSARRPVGHENSTHRWTAFIRSAPNERPVDEYIRKVRVFLHPSYRPDDIVDLVPPKFELSRWGWGEFPVRLQVFFCDKRNKPVELVYMLKLDDACTGSCVPGTEVPIDFELDRRGLSMGEGLADQLDSDSLISQPPANAVLCALFKALCRTYPLVLSDALPANCQAPEVPEAILELIPAVVTAKWTWGVAMTADIWRNSWPIGKRLSAEASRNRCLLSAIHSVLDRQGGDTAQVNVDTGDSITNASTGGLKNRLAETVNALCSTNAVEADVAESLGALVSSSTSEACEEAIELLQLWCSEYRADRTIRPDRHRGLHERSFAWSLRRWLRHNGFVPEPVLSNRERALCVPSIACVADMQVPAADDTSCPEPVPAKHEFFCSACGTLCVLRQKIDVGATSGDGRSAAAGSGPPENMYCCGECEAAGMSQYATVSRVNDILAKLPHGWDLADDDNDADALLMVDDDEASYSVAAPATTSKFEDIAKSLSQYHLQQQQRRSIAFDGAPGGSGANGLGNDDNDGNGDEDSTDAEATDELVLDWVWSAIRPLELTCTPASRFSAGNNIEDAGTHAELAGTSGTLVQLPDRTDEMIEEELDQRLVVGKLLADVTRMFLRDLVAAADQTMRKNQAARVSDGEPNGSLADAETKRRLLMLTPLHVLAAVKQDPEAFDVCSNAFLADGL